MTVAPPPMEVSQVISAAIDKADTILATCAAIASGGYAIYTKRGADRLTKAQADKTGVETLAIVAGELRTDLATLRADLKDCHDSKAELMKRADRQELMLRDLRENLAESMTRQGLPMKLTGTHTDLTN